MPRFAFDPNLMPPDNIELFYAHLRSIDAELANILQTAIREILPLPDAGPERNSKRSRANSLIQRALDSRS
jgi:hypothetical protein